ncbi:hypothetical protein Tco_0020351 [Tanacetum coccineum]
MKDAPFTQGTISSIPIGGSISPEGFLPPILLLVVIIVTVVIVAVILVVVVVAIVGVVIVGSRNTSLYRIKHEIEIEKRKRACSFMLCDLDFEPLSLSLSSLPSCDLMSLTNMLILLHYLESFKSELAEVFVFKS